MANAGGHIDLSRSQVFGAVLQGGAKFGRWKIIRDAMEFATIKPGTSFVRGSTVAACREAFNALLPAGDVVDWFPIVRTINHRTESDPERDFWTPTMTPSPKPGVDFVVAARKLRAQWDKVGWSLLLPGEEMPPAPENALVVPKGVHYSDQEDLHCINRDHCPGWNAQPGMWAIDDLVVSRHYSSGYGRRTYTVSVEHVPGSSLYFKALMDWRVEEDEREEKRKIRREKRRKRKPKTMTKTDASYLYQRSVDFYAACLRRETKDLPLFCAASPVAGFSKRSRRELLQEAIAVLSSRVCKRGLKRSKRRDKDHNYNEMRVTIKKLTDQWDQAVGKADADLVLEVANILDIKPVTSS